MEVSSKAKEPGTECLRRRSSDERAGDANAIWRMTSRGARRGSCRAGRPWRRTGTAAVCHTAAREPPADQRHRVPGEIGHGAAALRVELAAPHQQRRAAAAPSPETL